MADNNTIARPYAQAIFDIAQESGEIDKWANSLEHGKAILADDQLLEFLSKPSLSSEQKFTFITSIFAEIPDEKMIFSGNHNAGSNFIKLLIENSRIAVFPEIAQHFTALKSNIENSVNVTVTSASPLSDEQKSQIGKALKKRFDSEIFIQTEIDESLVGGAIIRAGDVVIDGSLKASLKGLANAINS